MFMSVRAGSPRRPVAELLEIARSVPLKVVPVRPTKRQPDAEAQLPILPDLPKPVLLRSAVELGWAGAEPPSADADHPGTPDAHLTEVSYYWPFY